jgi:hypothetical protein
LNAIEKQTHFALYVKNGCVTFHWQQIEARHKKIKISLNRMILNSFRSLLMTEHSLESRRKFAPSTHVGTSLIKLVLKQKEPWYEDSMAMKTVKFLEQNILFFDTLLHFFVFCFVLRSNVLIMICYSIVVYNVKKG